MHRIAIVTHELAGGGVATVVRFLYDTLQSSQHFKPEIISLSSSARDSASVRLLAPQTWLQEPQVQQRIWQEQKYRHVGANFTELEFQRYQPRASLTKILNHYDLIQIVSGLPMWGNVARDVTAPVCLQVATLSAVERRRRLQSDPLPRRLWLKMMTQLNRGLEIATLKRMDCIFVENAWMYQFAKKHAGADQVVFAPPGVDTHLFRPNFGSRRDYILSVGRFADPRKNVRLLLSAYTQLLKSVPTAPQLVLAGSSEPDKEAMALIKASGITDQVQIYANVSLSRLTRLYREAQFFVLSSDEEGLGMVILEAMASGLAVVSTDCGGPATVVVPEETGYLTPVGDVQAFATAIQKLVENPKLCHQMGLAGRQRVKTSFSYTAAGKVFLDKYEELLL